MYHDAFSIIEHDRRNKCERGGGGKVSPTKINSQINMVTL